MQASANKVVAWAWQNRCRRLDVGCDSAGAPGALRGSGLRRRKAGDELGLKWSGVTSLGMVAAPEHNEYVQDRRDDLDLAVRVSACAAAATAATAVVMLPHGLWLLWDWCRTQACMPAITAL